MTRLSIRRNSFRRVVASFALGLAALAPAADALAWGTKEHILLTRLAVLRTLDDPTAPDGLKTWLRTVTPDLKESLDQEREFFLTAKLGARPAGLIGLSHWAVQPDVVADSDKKTPVEPFGLPERPLHYLDLEYINTDPARRAYKHDLSSLPKLEEISRDMKDSRYKEAGMLPFVLEHSYQQLVAAFKAGKLGAPKDLNDKESALRWAGYLAHYAADNTQPHHATQDFQSRSYFADKRSAPNVHNEMEWRMNDDEKQSFLELRTDYWKALVAALAEAKDPSTAADPFTAANEISIHSYKQLPLVGLAAMHAASQAGTPDKPEGPAKPIDTEKFFRFESDVTGEKQTVLQMKAKQQAVAVVRIAKLWRAAWDEAHR